MSSPTTPEPQQPTGTREVTVTVPEHRADQFQALARRVLAVWEYRDAYGETGFPGRRRHRRGRSFGPGGHRPHGRCARRDEDTSTSSEAGSVGTV